MNSGERLQDVFVGIDVFGRGMIGGVGCNTTEVLLTKFFCREI